ncbi:hypothetical protein AB1Y20_006385 [Prymnesium parvum]|uniref:Apple domain-containing protein n=1 Tax=Prymnesium parvum TaxID=97485 RepID=A0AB34J328_PRYPA
MPCLPGVPATPLLLPRLHCDERYAASLRCAGHRFLFTRREVADDAWETLARRAPPSANFSPPLVTLPHRRLLSHNTAFACVRGRLLAFGGQALLHSAAQRGVRRATASARRWPLQWGEAALVLDGEPSASGCVEERPIEPWPRHAPRPPHGFTCEFDGKLSVARRADRLLLFSRANLFRGYGGRHVQLAVSDGPSGFSFGSNTLLHFHNYSIKQSNNIYFFAVRPLWEDALLALFPAVIEGRGGIFCSVSREGVHWSRPLRILASPVVHGSRTRDHPIDQAGPLDDAAIEIGVQHDVYLHLGRASSCDAVPLPSFCSYRLEWEGARPPHLASVCPRLASLKLQHSSPPPSPPPLPPFPMRGWRVGYCEVTAAGRGDCVAGPKGSFAVGEPEDCVQKCLGCPRCRFVSFSRENNDCSWFYACPRRGTSAVASPVNGRLDRTIAARRLQARGGRPHCERLLDQTDPSLIL